MKSYYIEEKQMEMTYIELRLLLYVDCEDKYKKITEILNYLNVNGFITNLTTFYCENMRAENIFEPTNVMSLTIDIKNDKLRFKFWNGASTLWLYHVEDLLDALETGRSKFVLLYDKYAPITELLLDFKNRWRTSIYHISYEYNPDSETEIVYHITFTEDVKEANYASVLINKINKEIQLLDENIIKDLNFRIEHSFRTSGCSECEKRRQEREQNKKS
jgi:hypothetical protein